MLITPKYARVVPTVQVGFRVPWWLTALKNVGRYLGRGVLVIAHSQTYSSLVVVALSAVVGSVAIGPWFPWLALGVLLVSIGLRVALEPEGFKQSVRGWWLSISKYRFGWLSSSAGWGSSMRRCDVSKHDCPLPLLLTTRSTPYVDKLRVKVPTGLDPTAFQDYRGELLRWGWGAQSTRMYDPQPKNHTVELWNLIRDPLAEPVRPFQPLPEPLPKAIPVALQEDGQPWLARIRGGAAHVFVCGISGSGKGSVVGAYLTGFQSGIRDGIVEAWGVDPQASELGMWRHLFKRLVFTREDAARMLEELVGIMHRRTRTLFGVARQHQPTTGDPFYFVPIDEGLDLLDKSDRKLYRRIDTALRSLLRMGRKASILVMFISQRAELDIVGPLRKDFPVAIALEQKMEADVDMVLGKGALAAGAKAHELKLPGEAYVAARKGIVRVRFPESTDQHIDSLPPAPGNEDPENLATVATAPRPAALPQFGGF